MILIKQLIIPLAIPIKHKISKPLASGSIPQQMKVAQDEPISK
jgi:hypothetical protein